MFIGISAVLLEAMKEKSKTMDELDRNCILLFDEMALKARLKYDCVLDKVKGFQDYRQDLPDLMIKKLLIKRSILCLSA